jgi:hypothetical protein
MVVPVPVDDAATSPDEEVGQDEEEDDGGDEEDVQHWSSLVARSDRERSPYETSTLPTDVSTDA